MANKYKVVAGKHIQGSHRYSKGDVVISDHDLIKQFPQKFEKLGPAEEGDESKGVFVRKPGASNPKLVTSPVVEKDEDEGEEEKAPARKTAPHHKSTKKDWND